MDRNKIILRFYLTNLCICGRVDKEKEKKEAKKRKRKVRLRALEKLIELNLGGVAP